MLVCPGPFPDFAPLHPDYSPHVGTGDAYMMEEPKPKDPDKKVAVVCQGGGIHGAFTVVVLTEILLDMQRRDRFELVGLSGTSAGALNALMVWYGLAPKSGRAGSAQQAINQLDRFWDTFAATSLAEKMIN